jgi:LDH2 family malate/lactate/ureidoglycolate dehydrogenase
MPEGWFVKPDTGESITDPNRSNEGILLPMGEYKGAGLALMLGLLGGVLNGSAFGRDVVDFNADDKSETNTGHFMVAIDIARFLPLATFTAEVDRHVRDFRQSKRLPGVDEIRLPGDRRAQCRAERLRDGVPIAPALLAQLDKLAAELKIKSLRER